MDNKRVKIIGIDFGTANTYVSEFSLEPETGEKVRAIDFGYNQVGIIPSSILYRKGKSTVIGKRAEDEWGESTVQEKLNYTFKTHFKPDIGYDSEAENDAENFLKILIDECNKRYVDIFNENNRIIFGMPAETDSKYRTVFERVIKSAGIENFQTIHEPVGALIHHLHYGDISPYDAEKGILVIDFGGGTCDFSFLKNLEAKCVWGDTSYGGRLFDDLFYSWYKEQNPKKNRELKKNNSEYYVHWVLCRKAKEYFSDVMHSDKKDSFNISLGNIQNYGVLKNITWDEFLEKSTEYIPDKNLINDKFLSGTYNSADCIEKNRGSIDLIKWFEFILLEGLKKNNIKKEDVSKIILTGGSSQWLFVKDIIFKIFDVKNNDTNFILRSQNPKSAISEGLSVLPYLKNKLEKTSNSLKKDLNKFVNDILIPEIKMRLMDSFNNLAISISNEFLKCFEKNINYYRDNGGSVEWFETKISNDFLILKSNLEESTKDDIKSINQGIKDFVFSEVNKWFSAHGIKYFGRTYEETIKLHNIKNDGFFDAYSKLYSIIEYSIECMFAAFLGSVCGGKGLALIASGPHGWIAGAAIGLVLSYLVLRYGRKRTKEQLKKISIKPFVLKIILRQSVINYLISKQRKKLQKHVKNNYSDIFGSYEEKIKSELKANISNVISQLTLLNQI